MMSEPSPSPDRRAFLRQTLAAAAAGPLAIAADSRARGADPSAQEEADAFLASYVEGWLPLETAASEAAWVASTDVTEAHTAAQVEANQALSEFVGAPRVIETVRRLLVPQGRARRARPSASSRRSGSAPPRPPAPSPRSSRPATRPRPRQSAAQDGFVYTLERPGEPETHPTANDIDRVLVESRDLAERRDVWEVSKTIGGPLREGLLRLRDLRNRVAQELGFDSFFALQVADYGLTVPEMIALTDGFLAEVRPLYEQLHTWAKHALAARYGVEAPEGPIPAHWLPNRWGQNWPGLVEGVDLDAALQGEAARVHRRAGRAVLRLARVPEAPAVVLYAVGPVPRRPGERPEEEQPRLGLARRPARRRPEPDERRARLALVHHGAPRAGPHLLLHQLLDPARPLPAPRRGQPRLPRGDRRPDRPGRRLAPYLDSIGLLPAEAEKAEPVTWLLDTALDASSVVFLPFAAGVMTHFERDFYAGEIEADALNRAWWDLVRRHQGIVPPGPRPETLCDPATKTHINDDPGQYYDYAIGTVIKFQLHDHIAREILGQDPRDCNYFGNRKVGDFLREILSSGATRDWNAVLREATGSALTARPLVAYFEPLSRGWRSRTRGARSAGADRRGPSSYEVVDSQEEPVPPGVDDIR